MTTILVVDDHPAVIEALRILFKGEGWRTLGLEDPARIEAVVELESPDLVLLDMNFSRDTTSGGEGMAALQVLRRTDPDLPVVLMTAWATVERAVEAIRSGAADYLTKPWDNDRLMTTCRLHLELSAARRKNRLLAAQNQVLRQELDASFDFSAIVGRSPAMVEVLQLISRVAASDATCLITGPPGTGKELVAHAIHANSRRREGPLVKVHVGALPESLFERELFGHVRGAFTDAHQDRAGRFEIADGGTLFLDEVGTLGSAQQAKLLRVLQEGEFEPLGSTRTRKVDVRVVAATNIDIRSAVARGAFREDLLYRLNTIEIGLPSLSDRPEDIEPLARHFLDACVRRHARPIDGFDAEALERLRGHRWPGNVRELKNAIERAVILATGQTISAADLPLVGDVSPAAPRGKEALEQLTLRDLERHLIQRSLDQHQGNVSQAARSLGLSRPALYRRMERFAIEVPEAPGGGTKPKGG